MEKDQFWKLLDTARGASEESADPQGDFEVALEGELVELPPEEVLSFQWHLIDEFNKTFTWDVVAAAVIIVGDDCDELDIEGFRLWLVSRGRDFLNKALQDIDFLGELSIVPDEVYYYFLKSVAPDVYEQLTFEEIAPDALPAGPDEPIGNDFQVKDLPARLPKLADSFGLLPAPQEDGQPLSTTSTEDLDEALANVSDKDNPYADS